MNILLTHFVDLDGITPIILCKYFNLPIDVYIPMSYDDIDDLSVLKEYADKDENSIIVTDYAISKNMFKYIKENFKNYIIFDHHENSENLPEDENIFVNTKKSATLLFYEWIKDRWKRSIPKIIDEYIQLVNIYDTWEKDSPLWRDCQNLNYVLWSCIDYEAKEKSWDKFLPFINLQLNKFNEQTEKWFWTDHEHLIIQRGIEKEDREFKNAEENMKTRVDSKGNKFILYHGSSKISQVCNRLLEKYEDVTYIINVNTFQRNGEKSVNGKLSIRGKEPFDVNKLQNINGHKQAGAGKFPIQFIVKLWTGLIKQLSYIHERE